MKDEAQRKGIDGYRQQAVTLASLTAIMQAIGQHDSLAAVNSVLAPELDNAAQDGRAPCHVHPLHASVVLGNYEEYAVAPGLDQLAHLPMRPSFEENFDTMLLFPVLKPSARQPAADCHPGPGRHAPKMLLPQRLLSCTPVRALAPGAKARTHQCCTQERG